MLKEERFKYILNRLNTENKVLLNQLSDELNVSTDTIRRDIKELDDQGLLKAVRGGAIPHSPVPHNFRDRIGYNSESKQIIAQKALPLLHNGQVVIFDGGTSALAVASILPEDLKITVITNSFPIVTMLEDHKNAEVLFAGGRLFKRSFVTTGHETLRFFKNIRADLCLLGICSIHSSLGVTTPDFEESEVKKVMINNSQEVIALSSIEKLETVEPYYICPTDDIGTIITNQPDEPKLKPYIGAGVKIF
ncbi:DeoR/GlpR family DNA-binding transcription regulator [Fulvivirga ulvae]|uniref:DeoR/GlpR family DNA-binding transcription regulator n=1 Tax=Fulvivirga ulvae TaxID=2904245 RepID=UPI001F357263|nr:DeoR/GlpR family DNA-binding transcription regulator [Fulvivirga ulvae]UII31797.1 DeoR/GlpR family DNA-binding transcription regulator [Fulvivirga ulvae]